MGVCKTREEPRVGFNPPTRQGAPLRYRTPPTRIGGLPQLAQTTRAISSSRGELWNRPSYAILDRGV